MLLPYLVFAEYALVGIIPTSRPACQEYHSTFYQRFETVLAVYNTSRLWWRCSTIWLLRVIDVKVSKQWDWVEITLCGSRLRMSSLMWFQGWDVLPYVFEYPNALHGVKLSHRTFHTFMDMRWECPKSPSSLWLVSRLICTPWWYAPRWWCELTPRWWYFEK